MHIGNPPDAPMLVPAIARITAASGEAPRAVTADRGYGEAAVDAGLEALGVTGVVIPRKGRPGAARQRVSAARSFRKLVKWRTGSEARISCLKRDYGWRRTLTDGRPAPPTWCGWGVLAHNATKITGLIGATDTYRTTGYRHRRTAPGTGPPSRTRVA